MGEALKTTASHSVLDAMRDAIRKGFTTLFLAALPLHAPAALTELSPTPVEGTTSAQAKPNIMLLMDTSGSMGWSHMPDELESITKVESIGYKSSQCNLLYYNPLQT